MKTKLKSIVTRAIALAFTFIAGVSLAATPVAMWNGNLKDGSTQGDYTLSLNGNGEADGIVTITGDKGIRFYNNKRTNARRVSVIVKYENLTATDANQVLVTFGGSDNSDDVGGNADMIGLYARANNLNANAVWSGNTWNQDTDRTKGAFAAAGQMAITYDYGADHTKGFMDGTLVYDTTGLRGDKIYVHYVGVGGKYNSTNNIGPASNLKVLAVAIFDAQLTDAEVAAFVWPKPIVKTTPKVYALNFDSVSGSMSGSADSGIPYFDLPADCWNNFSNASGTRTADGFDLSTPNKDVLDDGLRVTWASSGTWSWADATMPALKGYLDDGEHGEISGPTITVPGIPFEYYDIIILAATDDGSAFRPVTVNGTSYTADSQGYGVSGTANWGAVHYLAPTAGRNMMYIRGQSGNLTVQGGNNNGARGGIAAVIIAEAEVRKASTSGKVSWSDLDWKGSENPEAVHLLTISGGTTLEFDTVPEVSQLSVVGSGALTITGEPKILEAVIPLLIVGEGLTADFVFDASAENYTASAALIGMLKSAGDDKRFIFLGAEDHGATVNFGDPGLTLRMHIVFKGGTHVLQVTNSNRLFAQGATETNPTILVTENATINFTAKDLSGYGGGIDATGVIRVNGGSTINFIQSGTSTFFYRQRLWLDPGALVTFDYDIRDYGGGNLESNFRWHGGTNLETAQIYVPASETDQTDNPAVIRQIPNGKGGAFHLASDGTQGLAFFVGANSKLVMDTPFTGKGRSAVKYGEGVLEFAQGTDNVAFTVKESPIALAGTVSSLTLEKDTTVEVASGSATVGTLTGDFAITKTGAGMLNLPTSYTSAITLTGGCVNANLSCAVTIGGDVDLGTTVMPLGWTLDPASSGTLKLPAGFPFGQIAAATEIPANLAFVDSDGVAIASERIELVNGYLVLAKTKIVTPYNVSEPMEIEGDLDFGEGGSVEILTTGASLTATGTITLPGSGLPVSFITEDEYAVGGVIPVITAAAFKVGDRDATTDDFKGSVTWLPKGMAGEFQLVEEDGVKTLVFAITTSEFYTAEVAALLEGESLIRRFDAMRGVTTDANGRVTAWADLCGNAAAAPYVAGNIYDSPTLVEGDLRKYLDFGACDSHIDLGFAAVDNVAKTVIEVIDLKNDGRAWLMGDRQSYNFHRDQSAAGSTKCFNGHAVAFSVRDNGEDVGDGKSYVLPEGFRVVSMTTSADCSTDCFSGDRNGGDNRSGGRKLSEVLIFNKVLTSDELATVENYLKGKWDLAIKNTTTISGTVNWSELVWDNDNKFYVDAPTEITLAGNARLVYDVPNAPIGGITFVKGDFTLEQGVVPETGIAAGFTVPAGETFVFIGGDTAEETFTFSNLITVNGTLKTEGYVDLAYGAVGSATGNIVNAGGTLEIATGLTRIHFNDRGMKGTLTIDAGATLQPYGYVDAVNYDGETTVHVYGTLDMSDSWARWTLRKTNVMNFYTGSTCSGNGQSGANTGALQFNNSTECVLNFLKSGEEDGTIEFSAKLHAQNRFTMNVEKGVTVNLSGSLGTDKNPFTLTGEGAINLLGNYDFNAPVTISEGTTLIVNEGYSFAHGVTGGGLVDVRSGTYYLGTSRNVMLKTAEGVTLDAVSALAEDGEFSLKLVEGSVLPTIVLDGVTVEGVKFEDNIISFTYTPAVSGAACWYDFPFNGNRANVGFAGGNMSKDGGDLGDDPANFHQIPGSEPAEYDAIYTASHPYMGITYPAEWSAAVVAIMPDYPNALLMSFGTLEGGLIGLANGVNPDEVFLVKTTGNKQREVLATMKVPNATKVKHLYVFSKTPREIKIYLDGEFWSVYTLKESDPDITFGNGFQIGSIHGGIGSTGLVRMQKGNGAGYLPQDYSAEKLLATYIDTLRIYDCVIGPNASKILSEEFPYISLNGLYQRTLVGGVEKWISPNSWEQVVESGTVPAESPADGATVKIGATVDSILELNLNANVVTEAITFEGTGTVIVTNGVDNFYKVANSGLTKIDAPVQIAYGSLDISGGPLSITERGSLVFDLANFSDAEVFKASFIPLTGVTKQTDAVSFKNVPEGTGGRIITPRYDEGLQVYGIDISISRDPGNLHVKLGTEMLEDETSYLDENGDETYRFYKDDVVIVGAGIDSLGVSSDCQISVGKIILDPGEGNTLLMTGENLKIEGEVVIKSGTVKINNVKSLGAWGKTIRVCTGATFDLNGIGNNGAYSGGVSISTYAFILEEGATFTDSAESSGDYKLAFDACKLILEGNATVDASLFKCGLDKHYNYPTAIELGTNTLTKIGKEKFYLSAPQITGTGSIIIQEGSMTVTKSNDGTQPKMRDGTLVISKDATLDFDGYGGGAEFVVSNLVMNGSVNFVSSSSLTVNGTLSGSGTLSKIIFGETSKLALDGKNAITFGDFAYGSLDGKINLSIPDEVLAKAASIPVLKVTEIENLPEPEMIAGIPEKYELRKTAGGLGYKLIKPQFILMIK